MDKNNQNSANIIAVEFYVPEKVLDNKELVKIFDSLNEEEIYKNTGIRRRHVADEGVCVSDLGIIAATRLFEKNRIARDEIDMLILCTQGPDYFLPATSCIMQDILGLPVTCAAFDINLGCSGYVYGLAIANAFIKSNMADNILLIAGDLSSQTLNPRDRAG